MKKPLINMSGKELEKEKNRILKYKTSSYSNEDLFKIRHLRYKNAYETLNKIRDAITTYSPIPDPRFEKCYMTLGSLVLNEERQKKAEQEDELIKQIDTLILEKGEFP